ncbi:MAG TPA: DUF1489 domain-containing protein [Magnetospirillum sp.]|nr:DUF1489 domain-containing protein [Magnetospirillum sp.]
MIHLIKLAVGCDGVEALKNFQTERLRTFGHVFHLTRMTPKREHELTDGGSIYWVVKGQVAARQRVLAVETDQDDEGRPRCRLILDPEVVEVELRPAKPFQGWRYLKPEDAPRDRLPGYEEPPPEMAEELRRLGLI